MPCCKVSGNTTLLCTVAGNSMIMLCPISGSNDNQKRHEMLPCVSSYYIISTIEFWIFIDTLFCFFLIYRIGFYCYQETWIYECLTEHSSVATNSSVLLFQLYYDYSFLLNFNVFTVNEHGNICIAGLNRWASYATDWTCISTFPHLPHSSFRQEFSQNPTRYWTKITVI